MKNIKENLEEINQMILQGKALEALEKHYHDDVIMQENESQPTIGKDANLKREKEFFSSITEFRGAEIKGIAIGDNVSYVTWKFDYTHKDWGVKNYTQVSVQHWRDGKIFKEQYFYGN